MNYLKSFQTFFSRTPVYIILFVTARCNSRCIMCFNWKNIKNYKSRKELTIIEIKKISKNFGTIEHLTLTGGEPSLRDDIPEICRTFDKNNKVQFITFATNGLIPEKIGEIIKEILLTCKNPFLKVCLSLDGIGEKNDKIRGAKGGFEKVIKTYHILEKLKKEIKNFEIQVNTTVSYYNKNDIEKINKYVTENLKEGIHNICLTRGDARNKKSKEVTLDEYKKINDYMYSYIKGRGKENYHFSMIIKTLKLISRDIIANHLLTQKRKTPCKAGQRLVIINEIGDVFPCETLWDKYKFGNLRENDYDIRKILKNRDAKKIIKEIKEKKCSCTFENAIQNSIIYSPSMYPKIIRQLINIYINHPVFNVFRR